MRNTTIQTMLCCAAIAAASIGCDVDKTREGEMPEVEVKGGQLPEYDVETADVEVDSKKKTVDVPDVDVEMEKKTIEVPDVDVEMPDQSD